MFFDIVDMTTTYIQYLYLLVRISPPSIPSFYGEPFKILHYFFLDVVSSVGEEQRYNNPLQVELPAWLPLDIRLEFTCVAVVAPLMLATLGILGVYDKAGYIWFVVLLGSFFMFLFGAILLANVSLFEVPGSRPPSRTTLSVLVGLGIPAFFGCLLVGLFVMGRQRLTKLRHDIDRLTAYMEEEELRRTSQQLTQQLVDREELSVVAVAAERLHAEDTQYRIDHMDWADFYKQLFFVVVLFFGGLIMVGGIPISSIASMQSSVVFRAIGGLLLGIDGLCLIWLLLGCFRGGRVARKAISSQCSSRFLSLVVMVSSMLYTTMVTNLISLLYASPLVCPQGTRTPFAASLYPTMEGVAVAGASVGCANCLIANFPQQCSTSFQATICSVAVTQRRLVYDPRVPTAQVDGFFKASAILISIAYLLFLPLLYFYLARYTVGVLWESYPLEQRYVTAFSNKELYYQKVLSSNNNAAFVYRAYKPQFRLYRLTFLLQKIIMAVVGCLTRQGLEEESTWIGLLIFMLVPLVALTCALIFRPFSRPTELIYFPTLQGMVSLCAMFILISQQRGPASIPDGLWVFVAVLVVVVPIIALVVGTVLSLRQERLWEERLHRKIAYNVMKAVSNPAAASAKRHSDSILLDDAASTKLSNNHPSSYINKRQNTWMDDDEEKNSDDDDNNEELQLSTSVLSERAFQETRRGGPDMTYPRPGKNPFSPPPLSAESDGQDSQASDTASTSDSSSTSSRSTASYASSSTTTTSATTTSSSSSSSWSSDGTDEGDESLLQQWWARLQKFGSALWRTMCAPFIDYSTLLQEVRRHQAEELKEGEHGIVVEGHASLASKVEKLTEEERRRGRHRQSFLNKPSKRVELCGVSYANRCRCPRSASASSSQNSSMSSSFCGSDSEIGEEADEKAEKEMLGTIEYPEPAALFVPHLYFSREHYPNLTNPEKFYPLCDRAAAVDGDEMDVAPRHRSDAGEGSATVWQPLRQSSRAVAAATLAQLVDGAAEDGLPSTFLAVMAGPPKKEKEGLDSLNSMSGSDSSLPSTQESSSSSASSASGQSTQESSSFSSPSSPSSASSTSSTRSSNDRSEDEDGDEEEEVEKKRRKCGCAWNPCSSSKFDPIEKRRKRDGKLGHVLTFAEVFLRRYAEAQEPVEDPAERRPTYPRSRRASQRDEDAPQFLSSTNRALQGFVFAGQVEEEDEAEREGRYAACRPRGDGARPRRQRPPWSHVTDMMLGVVEVPGNTPPWYVWCTSSSPLDAVPAPPLAAPPQEPVASSRGRRAHQSREEEGETQQGWSNPLYQQVMTAYATMGATYADHGLKPFAVSDLLSAAPQRGPDDAPPTFSADFLNYTKGEGDEGEEETDSITPSQSGGGAAREHLLARLKQRRLALNPSSKAVFATSMSSLQAARGAQEGNGEAVHWVRRWGPILTQLLQEAADDTLATRTTVGMQGDVEGEDVEEGGTKTQPTTEEEEEEEDAVSSSSRRTETRGLMRQPLQPEGHRRHDAWREKLQKRGVLSRTCSATSLRSCATTATSGAERRPPANIPIASSGVLSLMTGGSFRQSAEHPLGGDADAVSSSSTSSTSSVGSRRSAEKKVFTPAAGTAQEGVVQELRCLFLLRQRLRSAFLEHQARLQAVQQCVNTEVNTTVRRILLFIFMVLGAVACLCLVLALCGMFHTTETQFIDGVHQHRGSLTEYQAFAGYASWEDFTAHCCCTAATGEQGSYPYYAIDVENWLCENGVTKERVRKDGYDDAVVDGYAVRGLCGMNFKQGCHPTVTKNAKGTPMVEIEGCSGTITSAEIARW